MGNLNTTVYWLLQRVSIIYVFFIED